MNDDTTQKLGGKIRYFRKRAGLSQFNLENAIGASAGSISRIENGEVNPSKETLYKIKNALEINNLEMRYLAGDTAAAPTQKEINSAIEEVRDYFENKKRLAYLVDDRQRIMYASRGFQKGFKIPEEFAWNHIYGQPTLKITLDPELRVREHFSKDDFERIVYNALIRFEYLTGFMKGDPIYEETVRIINKYPTSRNQYQKAKKHKSVEKLNSDEARTLDIKMLGVTAAMKFSVEPLARSDRFSIYEYTPTNPLLRLLSKL